jgi:hypothetical protein
VLVDAGTVGLWLKFDGLIERKEQMLIRVIDIAKAYQLRDQHNSMRLPPGDWFHLKYGSLNLSYLKQEHTYTRFEGHPLELMLEIEMDETQEVEKSGLVDKFGKFLSASVTPRLAIHKIRSHKRTVAGLKGDEIIMKMTEEGDSTLQFGWQYQGKEDSGDHPEIDITMESPDGNLDAKLKVWDAILDSFKPMSKSGK